MRAAVLLALVLESACAHVAPVAPPPPGLTPRLVGEGTVSGPDDEFGGALSADGRELYFTRSAPHSYRYTILVSRRLPDGTWGPPAVAPFSGQWTDSDPVFTPDGTRILWTSDRPVDGKVKHDYDIWMVTRQPGGGWGVPEHLPAPVSSDANEYFASMARDGTIYFSSMHGHEQDGAIHAFRSRPAAGGGWSEPEDLTVAMDGPRPDGSPWADLDVEVDPDQRFLLISSVGRPDGLGHFDLYVSWNRGGAWSPLVHLGAPFNTTARDYSPHVSPDGKILFFSSERSWVQDQPFPAAMTYDQLEEKLHGAVNSSGNIYEISIDALGKP